MKKLNFIDICAAVLPAFSKVKMNEWTDGLDLINLQTEGIDTDLSHICVKYVEKMHGSSIDCVNLTKIMPLSMNYT